MLNVTEKTLEFSVTMTENASNWWFLAIVPEKMPDFSVRERLSRERAKHNPCSCGASRGTTAFRYYPMFNKIKRR